MLSLGRSRPSGTSNWSVAVSSSCRLLVFAALLVNSIILSRGLGPEGRGYIQLMITLSALLAVGGGLSGDLGYSRLIVSRPALLQPLRATASVQPILLGTCIIAIAFPVIVSLDTPSVPAYPMVGLVLALLAVPFMIVNMWNQRMLLVEGRLTEACLVAACDAAVVLGTTMVLAATGQLTSQRALVGFLAGSVIDYLVTLGLLRPSIRQMSVRAGLKILRTGIAFHPSQLALIAMMRTDVLVLAQFYSQAVVGIYAVAVSVVTPLGILATTLANAFMSKQFTVAASTAVANTQRLVRVLMIVVGVLAVVIAGTAVLAIPVIWGPAFSESVAPTLVLLIGTIPLAVQRPLGQFFVREGMASLTVARAVVALIVTICACVLLAPAWGAIGVAVGASIGYLVYTLVSATAFVRVTKSDWRSLLPGRSDLGALAVWASSAWRARA